ncbi:MAG TPA: hypothetical protein VGM90_19560 [Kofleriaceae bacterium]
MRLASVVSCAALLAGCGRVGFTGGGTGDGGTGDDGSSLRDGGSDARPGDDGTGGLPVSCTGTSVIICDDFERALADYQGAFDGENDAAGMLSLTTDHSFSGTTALKVHLESGASARAIIYKDITPATTSIHYSLALRFDTLPDRKVFLPYVYLQDVGADQQLQIFPDYSVAGGLQIEAELIGSAGLIHDVLSESTPLPLGRWFVVTYDLELAGATPVVDASIDGSTAPPVGGPYIVDPFSPTNESVYVGTGFSEGGSPLDYWVDDVAAIKTN